MYHYILEYTKRYRPFFERSGVELQGKEKAELKKLGISIKMWSTIISGKQDIELSVLYKVADFFGVKPEELLSPPPATESTEP